MKKQTKRENKKEKAARAAYKALRQMGLDHEEAYYVVGNAYWMLRNNASIERAVLKK